MTIKIKAEQLEGLASSRLMTLPLAPALSLKLMRLMRKLREELEPFNATKNRLIVEHKGESLDGKFFNFKGKNAENFNAAYKELAEAEIDLGSVWPAKLTPPDVQLSAAEWLALEPIFDLDEPVEPKPAAPKAKRR